MPIPYEALGLGDVLEGYPFMGTLSKENTLIQVTEKTTAPFELKVKITYFGVFISSATITKDKEEYVWKFN